MQFLYCFYNILYHYIYIYICYKFILFQDLYGLSLPKRSSNGFELACRSSTPLPAGLSEGCRLCIEGWRLTAGGGMGFEASEPLGGEIEPHLNRLIHLY